MDKVMGLYSQNTAEKCVKMFPSPLKSICFQLETVYILSWKDLEEKSSYQPPRVSVISPPQKKMVSIPSHLIFCF